MSEEKNDQVEITFRLATQQLGQLAQLLEALSGVAKVPENARQTMEETVESGRFDPERFQQLTGAEVGEPDEPTGAEIDDPHAFTGAERGKPDVPIGVEIGGADAPAGGMEFELSDSQSEMTEMTTWEPELSDQETIPLPGEAKLPRTHEINNEIEEDLTQGVHILYEPTLPEASPAGDSWGEAAGLSTVPAPAPTVQDLSRQCQRDARRYDGGFPIY